ncbi:MAG: tetratricopeptide repeat protein [bacterium]
MGIRIAAAGLAAVLGVVAAAGGLPAGHPPMGGKAAPSAKSIHKRVQALRAQCEQDPKAVEPRLELGKLCLRFRLPKLAVTPLDEAVALAPEHAEALALAALAHYHLEDLDEAIGLWKRAVEADPEDKVSTLWLRRATERKEARGRLAALEEEMKQAPEDPAPRLEAGKLAAGLRQWPQAVAYLAEATRLAPRDAAIRRAYAMALLRTRKMDEAVGQLEACVKLAPDDERLQRLLAKAKELRDMHQALEKQGSSVPRHKTNPESDSQP